MISTKTDQIDFLLDGSEVTIGRDLSSIVHLSGIGISRYHASITLSQKHPVLHDLESTFGVRVNSVLLKGSVELNDGDLLTIGTHAFVVSLNSTMLSLCCSSAITDEIRIKAPGGDQGLRIGRDCENEISLSHPMVSRLHATVSYGTSDRLTIHDHKSTNGTFVNGYRVSDCGLYDGDIIQIGPCRLLIDQGKVIRFDDKNRIRIEVCGVSVKRDGAVLLNNVNISIPPGEFVAILGPSGAGKSTLIDALTGKIKPSSGEVYANGLPLQKFLNAFASSIGYVSQDTVLYKELTVGEIFREQSLLRLPHDATDQERTSRVNEVIDLLDLSKVVLHRVGYLSGGEARRVLLGVELLSSPAIIFLDEPLSGLDPGLVRRFMLLFRKISDQGHTLILITHNLEQLELCDHVIFLNRGESVFQGSPSELGSVFNTTSIAEIYDHVCESKLLAAKKHQVPSAPVIISKTASRMLSLAVFSTQLRLLLLRYFRVLFRDNRNTLLMLFQSPCIGLLLYLVYDGSRNASLSSSFYFCVTISSIWIGGINSIREISREWPYLWKDWRAGLSLNAFLGAKIILVSFVSIIQAGMLAIFLIVLFNSITFGFELFVLTGVGSVFGAFLGLCISAWSGNTGRAVSVLPMLFIPQIFFSGILIPFDLMNSTGRIISYLTISRPVFGLFKKVYLLDRSLFYHTEWQTLFFLLIGLIILIKIAVFRHIVRY